MRLTLACMDGIEEHITAVKEGVKFLRSEGINKESKFLFMTKLLQKLDTTNFFGVQANESFDVLTCINVIHFLNHSEKQSFFNTCHRLLKKDGKLIWSKKFLRSER